LESLPSQEDFHYASASHYEMGIEYFRFKRYLKWVLKTEGSVQKSV
jgi:hypothetical protein